MMIISTTFVTVTTTVTSETSNPAARLEGRQDVNTWWAPEPTAPVWIPDPTPWTTLTLSVPAPTNWVAQPSSTAVEPGRNHNDAWNNTGKFAVKYIIVIVAMCLIIVIGGPSWFAWRKWKRSKAAKADSSQAASRDIELGSMNSDRALVAGGNGGAGRFYRSETAVPAPPSAPRPTYFGPHRPNADTITLVPYMAGERTAREAQRIRRKPLPATPELSRSCR